MKDFSKYIVRKGIKLNQALSQLNSLTKSLTLIVVDEKNKLVGCITDGDVRRGLLQKKSTNNIIDEFMNKTPRYCHESSFSLDKLISYREIGLTIIPIIDDDHKVVDIINLRIQKSYLPLDAVIMAGGLGSRLRPLTENKPKPLLEVGGKEIIDYSFNRLEEFGIKKVFITVNYLKDQIINHFKNRETIAQVQFIVEESPLGTIGAVSLIEKFNNKAILLTNSDILTSINYEKLYLKFINENADIIIGTVPYKVEIPYGIIEINEGQVTDLREKPTYTYRSNSGIYIIKSEVLKFIPKNKLFNATDLVEKIIRIGGKVITYDISEYWLDIGKHSDFEQAQQDVQNLKL